MASITLTGTLLDPTGEVAVGDQIRFTHRTTTGETIQFARSVLIIPPNGLYNITLEFGLIFVEYLDIKDVHYKSLGVVTVNGDTTATDLPGLLNAIVPPTDAQLLLFQGILADTEDARDIALLAAAQQTTLELIASTTTHPNSTVLTLSGHTLPGDGGGGKWQLNGVVGQTSSQSPTQLADFLLNDGNGNQWALVDGVVLAFNGVQYLPLPFGATGNGNYAYNDNDFDKIVDPDRLNPATLAIWQNDTSAQADDVVTTAERTAGNGGGGKGNVISGTGTANGFDKVAHGTLSLTWVLRLDNIYDTAQFGALYDNSADDSPAIQATVDEWLEEILNRKITDVSEGSTTVGTSPVLKFSPKKCLLGSTINMTNTNTGFGDIDFGGAIFLVHPSFNLSTFAFEIFGHVTTIVGFDTIGFTKFMKLANGNLNTGMTIVNDWGASVTGLVFELDSQSTVTIFKEFRMNKVKKVIRITGGDKVIFKDGWLSISALENTLDGYFELDAPGLFPSLDIKDMLYVPIPQTETNIALVCIREAGLVHLDAALFGGEPAPIPLVMNLANGTLGSLRGCHITITNTLGFTSGANDIPTVELYALPNSVVFTNHTGFVEQTHTKNLVFFNTSQRNFAQAEIDLAGADFQLRVDGRHVNNFLGQQSADKSTLVKYYTSDAPTKRDFASQVNNVTPQTILTKEQGGKGVSYVIQILNSGNSASDRYSEYVAVSSDTASPNASWSLLARVEGVSTVASRLAVNGSGDIEVTGNSGALSDFEIIMHKIGVTEEF